MYVQHYIHSNTIKPKLCKNNEILSEKEPDEESDENNQKQHQKIVGKFMYYVRDIDPTMLMEINSLSSVQTKPKIETAKNIP